MSRSGFRNDRVFCSCERYDFPHRYDLPKCQPGYNSEDIFKEKNQALVPAKKPTMVTGWRCPSIDKRGIMCGNVNPFTVQRCKKCGE